jgi:hypothetical protein
MMTVHSPIDPTDAYEAGGTPNGDTALIPVPVRCRDDGWTPERQRAFIDHLAESSNVTAAARSVGMTPQSAWRLRRRADARAFDAAWEAALERGMDRLVSIALERAIHGTVRERYYHGELIAEERVHHNGLLLALIARGDTMLRHAQARRTLREDWDGGLDRLEAGAADPIGLAPGRYQVWQNGPWLVTDCPPSPGFRGEQWGLPHTANYWRQLTVEESVAYLNRTGPSQDEMQQAHAVLFGDQPPRRERRAAARRAARGTRRASGSVLHAGAEDGIG